MTGKKVLWGLLAVGIVAVTYLFGYSKAKDDQTEITIAYALFMHETCTFCPSPPTGIEQFEHDMPPLSGVAAQAVEAMGAPYVDGFLHSASMFKEVRTTPVYIVPWAFGGSSGSTITREAFEKYAGGIVNGIAELKKVDGVHLFLHGGMAVEGISRPEAEIVKRVRDLVGKDTPISATFDHHGNEDEVLMDYLDIGLVVKRFPHYDANLQGDRAARLLVRAIRGDYKPTASFLKPGVMYATVYGGTHTGAPQAIMERARRWENQHLDTYVSVFQGWSFGDVPDLGMGVLVMTNDDQALADRIAQDMQDYILSRKEEFEYPIPEVAEGVASGLAMQEQDPGKLVFANMSDRMGDSTEIAHELRRLEKNNFVIAALADQALMDRIFDDYSEGDLFTADVGGKSSELAGSPLSIEGTLRFIGKRPAMLGKRYATIESADNTWFILCDDYEQVTGPGILNDIGVPTESLDIFVVKSRNHFRRGFMETGFAKHAVIIDAPGHGPANIGRLEYKNMPVGMYSKYFAQQ